MRKSKTPLFDLLAPEPKPRRRREEVRVEGPEPSYKLGDHERLPYKVSDTHFLVLFRGGRDVAHWAEVNATSASEARDRLLPKYEAIDIYPQDEYYRRVRANEFALRY